MKKFIKENWFKISITACIVTITVFAGCYFTYYLPKQKTQANFIDSSLKCNEMYENKKSTLWGDKIGQSGVIYNKKIDSCLAFNMYSYEMHDFDKDIYYASVIDLLTGKHYLSYTSYGEKSDIWKMYKCQAFGGPADYYILNYYHNEKLIEFSGCEEINNVKDVGKVFNKVVEEIRSYGFTVRY